MASIYDRHAKEKAEKIKALVEEECEFYGIELDTIDVDIFMGRGTVTVYLEEIDGYNQGRIGQAVKSKWPDVECEYEGGFMIEFTFHIRS